jgi:hypothetical protein
MSFKRIGYPKGKTPGEKIVPGLEKKNPEKSTYLHVPAKK